jgi:hypothetical protein
MLRIGSVNLTIMLASCTAKIEEPCQCKDIPPVREIIELDAIVVSSDSRELGFRIGPEEESKERVLKPLAEGCPERHLKWKQCGWVIATMANGDTRIIDLYSGKRETLVFGIASRSYYRCVGTTVADYASILQRSSVELTTKDIEDLKTRVYQESGEQ